MNKLNLRYETAHEYVRLAVRGVNLTLKKKKIVKSPKEREEKERETERLRPGLEPPHL